MKTIKIISLILACRSLFTNLSAQAQKPELVVQTGHSSRIVSVAVSSDGKTVVSADADKTIKLWSLETGQELRTFTGHTESVYSIVFSPDGKTFASGDNAGTIRICRIY